MTLYALDDVEEAFEATKDFLWPFDLGLWTKLAVVVFFLGSAGGTNPFQFTGSFGSNTGSAVEDESFDGFGTISPEEWAIIGAIVAVIVLLGLLFALVGSVMEFVFVESLRREEVTIRRYWSDRWRQGVRLFGFRVGLGLLTLLVFGLVLGGALFPLLFGSGELSVALVLLAIPFVLATFLISGLVYLFTTMFVVPVMIAEDRTVIAAWRRCWPTFTGQWKQYIAYAVTLFALQIAVGIVSGIAMFAGVVVVGIPLLIVGIIGFALLSVSGILGGLVIALAILGFVLAIILVALYVSVPIQTFLRYHALLVLGDTNRDFDLIPARRRALRE